MNVRAPHTHRPTTSTTTRATTRTSPTAFTAVLFAAAIFFGEIEFVTAALLAGAAGIAVDLRRTAKLAQVRVSSAPARPGTSSARGPRR